MLCYNSHFWGSTSRVLNLIYVYFSCQMQDLGSVLHVFSHIRQTYIVYKVEVLENEYENVSIEMNKYQKMEWMTDNELTNSAISTAMKKVYKLEHSNTAKV